MNNNVKAFLLVSQVLAPAPAPPPPGWWGRRRGCWARPPAWSCGCGSAASAADTALQIRGFRQEFLKSKSVLHYISDVVTYYLEGQRRQPARPAGSPAAAVRGRRPPACWGRAAAAAAGGRSGAAGRSGSPRPQRRWEAAEASGTVGRRPRRGSYLQI